MKPPRKAGYVLDKQIGFVLRGLSQRHAAIFAQEIGARLTPTQWAALSKLAEVGACSQNKLGRLTSMDGPTIKGVVDRLSTRGLTLTTRDRTDARRLLVNLTRGGKRLVERIAPNAICVTCKVLSPLSPPEREVLVTLLKRLR